MIVEYKEFFFNKGVIICKLIIYGYILLINKNYIEIFKGIKNKWLIEFKDYVCIFCEFFGIM